MFERLGTPINAYTPIDLPCLVLSQTVWASSDPALEDHIPISELEQSQPKAILDGWMTRAELAKELGVCVNTLSRWQTMRIGPPCVRTGRWVFYRRDTVTEWLRQKEIRENRDSNL